MDETQQKAERAEKRKYREVARAKGSRFLTELVDYWIEVARGLHAGATHADRIRAGENIANRCGLPMQTDSAMPLKVKVKLAEMRGWRDASGKLHSEAEPDPAVKGPPFVELDGPRGNGGPTIQ